MSEISNGRQTGLRRVNLSNHEELSDMATETLLGMLQGTDSICSEFRDEIETELASRGVYPEPDDDLLGIEGG